MRVRSPGEHEAPQEVCVRDLGGQVLVGPVVNHPADLHIPPASVHDQLCGVVVFAEIYVWPGLR